MASTAYEQFFLHPTDSWHRRYEVLRAVFVDQQSLEQVAQQFSLNCGTVANWVSEFRRQCDAGQRPPFSFGRSGVARPQRQPLPHPTHRPSRLRMSTPCRWNPVGVCAHVTPGCFYFYRCSPNYTGIA